MSSRQHGVILQRYRLEALDDVEADTSHIGPFGGLQRGDQVGDPALPRSLDVMNESAMAQPRVLPREVLPTEPQPDGHVVRSDDGQLAGPDRLDSFTVKQRHD